jgi:hypothetical protein
VVFVLATGPKGHGFKSGRGQWIPKRDKNPQYEFPRGEGGRKPAVHVIFYDMSKIRTV